MFLVLDSVRSLLLQIELAHMEAERRSILSDDKEEARRAAAIADALLSLDAPVILPVLN